MKKIIPILIVFAFLIGFYFLVSRKSASVDQDVSTSDLILFYGNTCPHCKIVEEFISTNQIDQKIKISQLEVYKNKSNASLFSALVQKICPEQFNNNGLPVPFLIDQEEKKCFLGGEAIKDYLTGKSKIVLMIKLSCV